MYVLLLWLESIHNVLLTCLKRLMCWSEAQPNSGISKHTHTQLQQTVSCVLRRILSNAVLSWLRPRCGLAPDVPASIIS